MSVLIARYLGVEKIGIFNFLTTIYILLMPIQSVGMDRIAIDYIVQKPKETGKVLGTTSIIKFFFGIVAFIIGILYLSIFEKEILILGMIFFASLIVRSFESIDFYFQANIFNYKSVIAKNVSFGIRSVVAVILVFMKMPFEYFIYLFLFETIIYVIGLVVSYAIEKNKYIWSVDYSFGKQLLKKSLPIFISNILVATLLRSDQIFISYFLGYNANGLYSVAVKFAELFNFIPLAFTTIMLPIISSSIKVGTGEIRKNIFKMYALVLFSSISIAIFISLFSNLIVRYFYGIEFIDSAPVLTILIWSSVFSVIGSANGVVFVTSQKTKYSLYSTIIGAVFVLILNFLLIPRFGIVGAAFSTLISYIAGSVLIFVIFKGARLLIVRKEIYGK